MKNKYAPCENEAVEWLHWQPTDYLNRIYDSIRNENKLEAFPTTPSGIATNKALGMIARELNDRP